MKERPMIFNAEMVRAILDGRKTQTRRIMKPQPTPCTLQKGGHWWPSNVFKTMLHIEEEMQNGKGGWGGLVGDACHFGDVGDRIWVRETFAAFDADWKFPGRPHDLKDGPWPNVIYPASRSEVPPGTLRPSIHMPRWASRITLEITGVRVERLQNISDEDVDAEGFAGDYPTSALPELFPGEPSDWSHLSMRDCYGVLWQSIYGEDSWQANPWVWVIEFKRIEGGGA
ncbi:hypothetical protein [Kosakonia sp. 1610]|uniref:hypothetical protein n=1 Tax=Kosakonia sp. 1610 TaxID=3156426 RepID=UPI003D1A3B2A